MSQLALRLWSRLAFLIAAMLVTTSLPHHLEAQTSQKPNILVIWGDDVGVMNFSAYHKGMMGGTTPNIDRLAKEGAMFTDAYAQQSCTAGRASFIGLAPITVPVPKLESGRHWPASGLAGA